jgi:ATP-dependent Clp protease ATP-binding subunit ClpX
MEELLMDTMFELPNIDLEKVIVDENSVAHSTDPIKVYKSPKKKSSSAG